MTTRMKSVVYWIMTSLVAFFIGGGGFAQIWQYHANPHGMVPLLNYPLYFFAILGVWKILGALTILVPGHPLVKEWAYAGIFFDLTGAAASCAFCGSVGAYGFHVIAPLILTGVCIASWALRPPSRKISIVFPARNAA